MISNAVRTLTPRQLVRQGVRRGVISGGGADHS